MKNTLDKLNTRLDNAQKISELQNMAIKTI